MGPSAPYATNLLSVSDNGSAEKTSRIPLPEGTIPVGIKAEALLLKAVPVGSRTIYKKPVVDKTINPKGVITAPLFVIGMAHPVLATGLTAAGNAVLLANVVDTAEGNL